MARVLRVEDANGLGPFCRIAVMNACNDAMGVHDHHADMPSAQEEVGVECHWRCGVPDARLLVRWFPRAMRRVLADRGYRLHVLDVPEASIRRPPAGGTQVVYDPDAARTVASRPLAAITPTAITPTGEQTMHLNEIDKHRDAGRWVVEPHDEGVTVGIREIGDARSVTFTLHDWTAAHLAGDLLCAARSVDDVGSMFIGEDDEMWALRRLGGVTSLTLRDGAGEEDPEAVVAMNAGALREMASAILERVVRILEG